ncbi:YibE/F family protein [Weissella halotolerans]|uniref:Integral membrane protein n=1 Tax=Weissella halotolerans DSM 20190 TaxID=1123500 RepID=A0A0R2FZF9_9LACO|nr:YibE/F family protein [Weissella halotolerans]KRN33592.1 integral membrane protein [Weissella halotolerans DSM 20190]
MRTSTTKNLIYVILILVITGLTALFFQVNSNLYKQPIGRVTQVTTQATGSQVDQFKNRVKTYQQTVTLRLLNRQQPTRLKVTNYYDAAQGMNQPVKEGQQVFLNQSQHGHWQIDTIKRDGIWVPFLVLIAGILILVLGPRAKRTLCSLGVNIGLFILFLWLSGLFPNVNLFYLFCFFSALATIVTLGLVLGFKQERTWTIVAAVLTTTLLTLALAALVFNLLNNRGIYFEHMEYTSQDPYQLLMAMTVIGVLGAVMDEATDITTTLYSVRQENPDLNRKQLAVIGRQVGQEIFGALNNVLFLIFIAEQIPMTVLYFQNGNSWPFTYTANLSIGMIQTLISAIGIVLTVPVSIGWFLVLDHGHLKWLQQKEN